MITHLFIISLAAQTRVALSSKYGFQAGQGNMLSNYGGINSEAKNGRLFSNFVYKSGDVVSFANGSSNSSVSCYYFVKLMAIALAGNIQNNKSGSFEETREGVFNAIRRVLKEYKSIVDKYLLPDTSQQFASEFKQGSDNGEFGQYHAVSHDMPSCKTSFNTSFIVDNPKYSGLRLNMAAIGDSNVTHFKLINDNGKMMYIPTVVTDNDSITPGDYKDIETAGYRKMQCELEQYSGLDIIKPIAMTAYSIILGEQFQMYSASAAVDDLVLSADSILYDNVPIPLLTIFINYSIKSLESSFDTPQNVNEELLKRIVKRFSEDFNNLVEMEQHDYLKNLKEADFQEQKDYYNNNRAKAGRVYGQILKVESEKARKRQTKDTDDQFGVPKPQKTEREHFKRNYVHVKTIDKKMGFVETTPFDLNRYLELDVLKQMNLEDNGHTPETKKDTITLFNPFDSVSLFDSCAFKELVQHTGDKPEISVEYIKTNECMQRTLSKLTFRKNFFNQYGYGVLGKMVTLLATKLQKNAEFKATPFMHNRKMGKEVKSESEPKDPAVFITRIVNKKSPSYHPTSKITQSFLEEIIADTRSKMGKQVNGFVTQKLAEHSKKALHGSEEGIKLI